MLVLLLRHATAEPHGSRPDAERALVEKGWRQVARAACWAREQLSVPDLVLTSPLVRARETAEGVAEAAGWPEPVVAPWLGIGRAAGEAIGELAALRDLDMVCMVGHEPDFSSIAATLLGTSPHNLRVTKASLIGIECRTPRPGGGTLAFHIPNRCLPPLAEVRE